LAVCLGLPVVIGIGATWKALADIQALSARQRSLDLEKANYRAATEALARQIESQQASDAMLRARASSAPRGVTPDIRVSSTVRDLSPPAASPAPSRTPAEPGTTMPPRQGAIASQEASRAPATTSTPSSDVASQADVDRQPDVNRDAAASTQGAQLVEAMTRLNQRRVLAEDANANTLASRSYLEARSLELEAKQLATTGQTSDALLRAIAAEAGFRAALVEARNRSVPPPVDPATRGQGESARLTPAQTAEAENSIRGVIAEYVGGLESRNLAALKRVWPSLGGNQEKALRSEFANARTVQALFSDPRITINDDVTTVTGVRKYSLETQDGQRLFSTTRTTITLRRRNGVWVIDQVVHDR